MTRFSSSSWRPETGFGSISPVSIDDNRLREAFQHPELKQALLDIGLDDDLSVLGAFLHGPAALEAYARSAPLVTDDRPRLEYATPDNRPIDPSLRRRSIAELREYLRNLPSGQDAPLAQRVEAWQELFDFAGSTVSVPDDSVRALYYYSRARRIRVGLPDNRYAGFLLQLDESGMRQIEDAARSGSPKSVGAWAIRLILLGRSAEAEAILAQAAARAPQHPLPRLLLGVLASAEGHADAASREIRQGLDLLSTPALRQIAVTLLQEGGVK